MLFVTRNEILANLAFFVIVMILKLTGLIENFRSVVIVLPIVLALFLSKLRSNRANIPAKTNKKNTKKNAKNSANFLNDEFVQNKALSYGATILWLSTLLLILTMIINGF